MFASKIKYFTFALVKLLRYILFPFVPFYYLATWFRNKLYDFGLKTSKSFDVPVICVGNLSVGGTGKTPMLEYLIKLLRKDYNLATLSRGYKRKSKGFIIADKLSNNTTVGDEAFQLYKKFDDIIVSVDSNRSNGITQLLNIDSKPDVILMDDGFQHRSVKAGCYILLTSYDCLYSKDMVLPTGNLREPKSGADRAQIIVVTKCPEHLSQIERQDIINSLGPKKQHHVFFSSISYSGIIKNSSGEKNLLSLKGKHFTLVTGIANPQPLVEFLNSEGLRFQHLNYTDHYEFTEKDILALKAKGLLVTTEKDFMRLEPYFKNSDTIFYLPIETILDEHEHFDSLIKKFIANF